MKGCYPQLLLVFGFVALQAAATRITLDVDAQKLCNKYKRMCKDGKVCAVQHFDWPQNITLPVCIPLSFVPVRNEYCQLLPDSGRCHARYIRWFFDINTQECSHFQYGGCEGNQNNFKSKADCEQTCKTIPAIRVFQNGQATLIQPAVVSPPIYEPPSQSIESLTSVRDSEYDDRYHNNRYRNSRTRHDSTNNRTRRRLDKEKEKEKERKRRDRERRREKKRLRRLRKKELKKQKKKEQKLKELAERKRKPSEDDLINETQQDDENALVGRDTKIRDQNDVVKETKDKIESEIEAEKEKKKRERRRERKRLKRRERRKRKLEKERKRLERLERLEKETKKVTDNDKEDIENTDLGRKLDPEVSARMFSRIDQGKDNRKK